MPWSELWGELRLAVRHARRHPTHSLTCIAVFALGLGANTAIVSVLYSTVLRPLPYREPASLVAVHNRFPLLHLPRLGASSLDYLDLCQHHELFAEVGAFYHLDLTRTAIERPVKVNAIAITSSLFRTLGSGPLLGRLFNDQEEHYHGANAVILSESYWRTAMGADTQILQRTLELNGELYPVVGVMPDSFHFPNSVTEMWVPLTFQPKQLAPAARTNHYLRMYGRLAPGLNFKQASAKIEELSREMSLQYPEEYPLDRLGWRFFLLPMDRDDDGSVRSWFSILFAAVTCLLLIVCANVSGLFLVRSAERQFDFSLRMALGANRSRIAWQVMSEILVLALAGGAAGLLVAELGVRLLTKYGPASDANIASPVFGFSVGLSLLCGIMCGFYPAWNATKDPAIDSLKEGGHQRTTSVGKRHLQRGLIVAQVGVATTLLICGGLFVRSLIRLIEVPLGFDARNVLTMQISLPAKRYVSPESRVAFYHSVLDRAAQIPGVEAVSGCTLLPFGYGENANTFEIVGRPKPGVEPYANLNNVPPGFIRAMTIPLLRGRDFTTQDRIGSEPVALIDQTMVRRYFADQNPIGQQLRMPWDRPFTIIGVVGGVKTAGLDVESRPAIYFSSNQYPSTDMSLVIRSRLPQNAVVNSVQQIITSIDRDQPVYDVFPLQDRIDRSLKTRRFVVALVVSFAGAGTVLAALGLYGLLSYTIALRRREIGIRMALGADARTIALMVYRGGFSLVLLGLVLGCAGALAAHGYIDSQLYGTNFKDGPVLIGVIAIIGLTGFLSCALPAWRTAMLTPLESLRAE